MAYYLKDERKWKIVALVKIIRRRYIAFKLTTKSIPTRRWILENLTRTLPQPDSQHQPHFDYLRVIEYDDKTGLGIIRCGHKALDAIRVSIGKMPYASQDIIDAEVLGVSGTLKALRRKFLKNNKDDGRIGER